MNVKGSVEWRWVARDGTRKSIGFDLVDLSPASIELARQWARKAGYPGHKGGWWNYFVDDIVALFDGRTKAGNENR